jgi:hypothetical protein
MAATVFAAFPPPLVLADTHSSAINTLVLSPVVRARRYHPNGTRQLFAVLLTKQDPFAEVSVAGELTYVSGKRFKLAEVHEKVTVCLRYVDIRVLLAEKHDL